MSVKIPNWLASSKRINSKSCIWLYKETLGKKLGSPRRFKNNKKVSFEHCRKEVKKYNFLSQTDYCKNRKPHWPSNPSVYYAKEWRGWSHFLGRPKVIFLSFKDCREEVRSFKFKSRSNYRLNKKPNWPSAPNVVYKDEWISWYDFLGKPEFCVISFEQCREEVKKLNFANSSEYKKEMRNRRMYPLCPNEHYAGKGWSGWRDFLGR